MTKAIPSYQEEDQMSRKKAIITGGEIGMGRGIAMVLAEEGW